jgi:PEP-CTERM motif
MKKYLITMLAVMACAGALTPKASAQAATFAYNDGNGTPNAGSYTPGSSFTFALNLVYVPGGSLTNLEGLSYWLQQNQAAPFNFAITLRDVTGSQFTALQTPSLTYPQNLVPNNANDLGALLPGNTGLTAPGTYFIANLTISINAGTAPGVYTLQNVVSGGKTAFAFNDQGTGTAIPASIYTVTVVPEPTSLALAGVGCGALLLFALRRRTSRSS